MAVVHDERQGSWLAVIMAVGRRPGLWWTAVIQSLRLVPPGWWHRRPFLPWPPAEYLAFRQVTATGTAGGAPGADDVVSWLCWCRDWRRTRA